MADAGEAEVPNKYLCPICREVLKKPTSTPECLHRFCDSCLRQTRPCGDGALLCPVCRLPFLMSASFHDRKFERELSGQCFICRGCKHKLPLPMYNGHQTTCKRLNHATPPRVSPVVAPTSQNTTVVPNRSTFKCPLCHQDNLECNGLLEHVNTHHTNDTASVVCPICASMPWGNPVQKSGNFVAHLNLRHTFEYDTYVDFSQDEDVVLQAALQASISDS